MAYQRLKKVLASFALSALIPGSGLMVNSVAFAATARSVGQVVVVQ